MSRPLIPLAEPAQQVLRLDPDYPQRLSLLPAPPAAVWTTGPQPRGPAVAIVGTRAASAPALELAHDLAAELACHGVTILSGGARGIDTAAHRGALTVAGTSWGILATGLRHPYPVENAELFAELVASGGGLLSEAPPAALPHRGRFLSRNRLIAALADAVVIVQAPLRSGAMSTAHWAKRLNKQLFSVPGDVWDPRFAGSNRLLAGGATVCTSAADVLSVRPSWVSAPPSGASETLQKPHDFDGLDACCGAVLASLRAGVRDPDRIAAELDIRINRVHESLLNLELVGLVQRRLDGGFGLRPQVRPSAPPHVSLAASAKKTAPEHGSDQKEGLEEEGRPQEEGDQEESRLEEEVDHDTGSRGGNR